VAWVAGKRIVEGNLGLIRNETQNFVCRQPDANNASSVRTGWTDHNRTNHIKNTAFFWHTA
jgi:hypothetical protein